MNDDYLWDRTGEPDLEIQQLEEVLGTLRYQPQPLELPPGIRPERRRKYLAPLAIAATIALMILATGLWLRIHRSQTSRQGEMAKELPPVTGKKNIQPVTIASPPPGPGNQQLADFPERERPKGTIKVEHRKPSLPANFAKNRNRHPSSVAPQDDLSVAQLDEVRAAKEQLMLALRLASAKLNIAQRKTQGPPLPSTIRNQHRVG